MKLQEYKAKRIFSQHGIPVPKGYVVRGTEDIEEISGKLSFPVVLKAQVLVGGRGKAGGIKFADSLEKVGSIASELIGMDLKGHKVKRLLVEEKVEHEDSRELYVGLTVNREDGCATCILSSRGGVDIEEVAREHPGAVAELNIDPDIGLQQYHCRRLAKRIGLGGRAMLKVAGVALKLYDIFKIYDGELGEINPLILTGDGGIVAVDAVLNIDNNALFRHPELKLEQEPRQEYSVLEREARAVGLSYVELDGDIGVIGCGAGLVMASLDIIKEYGGGPANFLDVGGGANAENMGQALRIVTRKPGVRSVFINIFGGITRCDEIARGIVNIAPNVPISVRMMGTNQEEGKNILTENGHRVFDTMGESARHAVELAKHDRRTATKAKGTANLSEGSAKGPGGVK